ncbi:MAG: oligosaccharide flippase family protein [Chitinophagaceae bacterium]|nr:oligosaccharide flippase family protein [Chitinophagaceae bacterium]
MAGIKQLAGQTLWYGVSSIVPRLLNYLLTPYLTLKLSGASYGDMTLVYALISFLFIIYTYGLETAYFRFSQKEEYAADLYNTTSVSIITSTILLTLILWLFVEPLARITNVPEHPEYIKIALLVVAFDTLAVIPFAKLRQVGRPVKYAVVRISAVLLNIGALYFFLSVSPRLAKSNPNSIFAVISNGNFETAFVIIANALMSLFTLLLLWKEFKAFRWQFNTKLWKEIMIYSSPMLIVGFGGMVNETLDRMMLGWWGVPVSGGSIKDDIGTYGACYKLSILISLSIQAFRLGAEPFFFKQASGENPQRVYARVMKFFVIALCLMFLFVSLYLDVWKHFIQNKSMWAGLKVVPVLLLANMFLGIYYNLSVWYKVTNKISSGAWITIAGTVVTILINYLFIPAYSYVASAWATFFCYLTMMVSCYIWGQKEYPVPYAWKKLLAYIIIVVLLFFLHKWLTILWTNQIFSYTLATMLLLAFGLFILKIEKKEFQKMPVIGKYIR